MKETERQRDVVEHKRAPHDKASSVAAPEAVQRSYLRELNHRRLLPPHDKTIATEECVAGVEAQSRRVFALCFLSVRAGLDIVFALLFELLTLVLHILRKVSALLADDQRTRR